MDVEFEGDEAFSYENTLESINLIVDQIKNDSWKPSAVVGLARGGLVPATMLSYRLGVPLIPVTWSLRDAKETELDLKLKKHLTYGRKVLIVDDIVDSGYTFETFHREYTQFLPEDCYIDDQVYNVIRYATLIYNTGASKPDVHYKAKLIDRENDKKYYNFYWESEQ